ncbi:LysR family transcriptional regulator [Fodinicola feengrottensis]|uniref:LysR family transcriptional regulator n=1 Tax=Fodinicola feengrottensis TaxID=435914 RepID=A0ABP4SCN5_9ACTN
MLLRQLEYLTALAAKRHFARAAAECHVSQPSLSDAIRKLEDELGVPLVRRGRRFAGFTPEGERVVMWARRILAERNALEDEISAMREGLTGQLRVGAIPTALNATALLTTPLCVEHPLAKASLEALSSRDILRRLADADLDVGVSYLDNEPVPGVRTVALYEEHYLFLTPLDSEFGAQSSVTWAEISQTPLCLLLDVMQNRRILDGFFSEAGVVASPAIETDTISALYAHVATHRWSSVIAHAWLYPLGVPEGMRVVPVADQSWHPQVGLLIADREPQPMMVTALLDVARRTDVRRRMRALAARYGVVLPS